MVIRIVTNMDLGCQPTLFGSLKARETPPLASESLRATEKEAGSEFQEAMLSQESELTWSQHDGV